MRSLFSIFFSLLLVSCQRSKNDIGKFDQISETDTSCLKSIARAKDDIKKGKSEYYYHAGALLYIPLRCEREFDSLLLQFNIEYKDYITSDVLTPGQTQGCYEDYMNESIARRLGKTFIDSLLYRADSIYITKHLDSIYESSACETIAEFPGDTADNNSNFNPGFQIAFDRKFTYPGGYLAKQKDNAMAFLNLNLEIDRFGKAKIIESYFVFDNELNHKFEKEFRRILDPILLSAKWKPATIKKQLINSRLVTFLYFK